MEKDDNLRVAYVVNNFLNGFWNEIPNMVANNWIRFKEYLEVILFIMWFID